MKKYIKFNLIKVLAFVLLAVSCSDILDETPDNRIDNIISEENIAELLTGAYPDAAYVPFLEPMSDNAGDKGPSADTGIDFATTLNERMYFWRDINDVDEDTPTYYWNRAYKAIAQANQALASINALGAGSEYDYLKGEALLCRAYAHFMLVSIFSKSYNPSTASSDVGIPYVTEPETVLLGNYDRGTVASVYNMIEEDLVNGLPLVEDNYKVAAYHFTKSAANAFASRFYLNKGEWQKVIDYSSLALGSGGTDVLRDWTNEYGPKTYDEQTQRYRSAIAEPANLLLVSAESSYDRYHFSARYQLSNTLASRLFLGRNITGGRWAYSVFGSTDLFFNIPKFEEYFKVTNQAAGTGNAFVTYVLLSADEVMLNRAEAYAMLGQLDNALADINTSYIVKTAENDPRRSPPDPPGTPRAITPIDITDNYGGFPQTIYQPFYDIPSAALPYIAAVLDLKQTIFYNDGLRWFDIKRLNMMVQHRDFLGNTFILENNDNRKLLQIPQTAQSFGIPKNPR